MWYQLKFDVHEWDEDDHLFLKAEEAHGKVIVKMTQACPGYWDLEFEDGTKFDAVHTVHIVPTC